MHKEQLNVRLDPDLMRRVKHHAIDHQLSVSDLIAKVLEAHLNQMPISEEELRKNYPALFDKTVTFGDARED